MSLSVVVSGCITVDNWMGVHACNVSFSDLMSRTDEWPTVAAVVARSMGVDPAIMEQAILLGCWVQDHPQYQDGAQRQGPLGQLDTITYEEFCEAVEREQWKDATKAAKKQLGRKRRSEFASVRASRVLELIDSGVLYVCAHPGCTETTKLTIDHVKPLSRGGTDDLSNLQFMCARHNSQKGDRFICVEAESL